MNLPVSKISATANHTNIKDERSMSSILQTTSNNVNSPTEPLFNDEIITGNVNDFQWFPESWRFTPIRSASKAPIGKNWGLNPMTWMQVASYYRGEYLGVNVGGIGVICGESSGGLLLFDHDGDSCDELLENWGVELPETWKVHGCREGHYQLVYWISPEFWDGIKMQVYKTGVLGVDGKPEQIEFRWGAIGEQKQSVIFGEHKDTKRFYQWENLHIKEIPHAPMWMIEKMLKEENTVEKLKASSKFDSQTSDSELAKQALEAIIPDHLDWYTWRNCLLAAHDSGVGESDVLNWSRRSSKHSDSGFYDVWKYIKGSSAKKVSLGTLIYLAKKDGFEPPRKQEIEKQGEKKMTSKDLANRLRLDIARIIKITDAYERLLEEQKVCEVYRIPRQKLDGLVRQTIKGGLTESRAPKMMTVEEALAAEFVAQDWLVEELLPLKTNTVISGLPGTGKSRLTTDLAVSLAMGTEWLGFKTKQCKVLLINSDQQLHHTARFVSDAGFHGNKENLMVVGQGNEMDKWSVNRMDLLDQWLDEFKPDLVIIDSIVAAIADPLGLEMKDQAVASFISDVHSLVNSKGAGVVWVAHSVKSTEAVGVNVVAGSIFIGGAMDMVWTMEKTSPKNPDCTERRIICPKNRQGKPLHAIIDMNPENFSFEYKGAPGQSEEQVKQAKHTKEKIMQFLASAFCQGNPWVKGKQINEFTGASNTYSEIGRALNKGLINAKPDESSPNSRFKVYSVNESTAERYASPDAWKEYLKRKSEGTLDTYCKLVATTETIISPTKEEKNKVTPPSGSYIDSDSDIYESTAITGSEVAITSTINLLSTCYQVVDDSNPVIATDSNDTEPVSGDSDYLLSPPVTLGGGTLETISDVNKQNVIDNEQPQPESRLKTKEAVVFDQTQVGCLEVGKPAFWLSQTGIGDGLVIVEALSARFAKISTTSEVVPIEELHDPSHF